MTVNSHSPSSRRDSGPVKLAGICWATSTGQGNEAGRLFSKVSSAGGPPVEVPTSTRPSPVAADRVARVAREAGRTPLPMRCRTRSRSRSDRFNRTAAACRTFSIRSGAISSIRSDTAPDGLATKSMAPSRSASSVASAPSAVIEETMITGHGCSIMMRSRQARPSISGMWTSRVTTSGTAPAIEARASLPLRANETSKSGWVAKTLPTSLRTSAESSTTRTLITGAAAGSLCPQYSC